MESKEGKLLGFIEAGAIHKTTRADHAPPGVSERGASETSHAGSDKSSASR